MAQVSGQSCGHAARTIPSRRSGRGVTGVPSGEIGGSGAVRFHAALGAEVEIAVHRNAELAFQLVLSVGDEGHDVTNPVHAAVEPTFVLIEVVSTPGIPFTPAGGHDSGGI